MCSDVTPAGPGFINFVIKPDYAAGELRAMTHDLHGGVLQVAKPLNIVVDYSSPNTAKQMHVGHIRSTFLGDALARLAKTVGHHVITDNHLGDWGTQFGKIIHGYKTILDTDALKTKPLEELERLYKEIHSRSESDPATLTAARNELVKLQGGDPENNRIWKEITEISMREFHKAYDRMGVVFDYELGESFYNPMLQLVVDELAQLGVAEKSEGATCIFFREHPELSQSAPMLIQKSDGAFLYATTDLATVFHRSKQWNADQILYVTDARQQLHFKQLAEAVKKWVAATPDQADQAPWKRKNGSASGTNRFSTPDLRHVAFGSILGTDKKPIKTRSGDPIKLVDLLEEAESRARKLIEEKNPDLTPEEKQEAAKIIGIGALKYADLSQNRNLDYVFDWEKLLSLQGNTAPYLIYAYVRIRSIFRSLKEEDVDSNKIELKDPEELALGKHLVQFSDVIHATLADHRPHLLTSYLYELAARFSRFYEACPVLKAAEPMRSSRIALSDLTARVLKRGLNLLGIGTLEKM
jgi:arginyl-tRNA synthetase